MVSLLESDEAAQLDLAGEPGAADASGIGFISFPIPDRSVPDSTFAAIALMTRIANALGEGKNVAVHCRQGIGRSGLIAAGVLITSGVSPGDAIRAVSAARGVGIPETIRQRQWVERLASRPSVVTG